LLNSIEVIDGGAEPGTAGRSVAPEELLSVFIGVPVAVVGRDEFEFEIEPDRPNPNIAGARGIRIPPPSTFADPVALSNDCE
jgi:hypothetical protein